MSYLFASAIGFFLALSPFLPLCAEEDTPVQQQQQQQQPASVDPFTGKITKNKVRIRLQPSLDAKILRELAKDDLVIVLGETDDFYAIQPPADVKGYVFRTLILDDHVEGNRVNVRSEPDLEAPVLAQLSQGDHVENFISPLNSKWLEIVLPSSARFYVSKDYVEKIGNADMMAAIEKQRKEVNDLLAATIEASQAELKKDYADINLDPVLQNFYTLVNTYSDFTEQSKRAKELLAQTQEAYLQKKIAYLEEKTKNALNNSNQGSAADTPKKPVQQPKPQAPESKISDAYNNPSSPQYDNSEDNSNPHAAMGLLTNRMAIWKAAEHNAFSKWLSNHQGGNMDGFYEDMNKNAIELKGIVEHYPHNIKNRPGDYVLISIATGQPTAYLYSTLVNLQNFIGREVLLRVGERPNNHFAYPAYFVLSAEEIN